MRIKKDILEHISLANEMLNYSENIEELAKICCDTIKNEKKIWLIIFCKFSSFIYTRTVSNIIF